MFPNERRTYSLWFSTLLLVGFGICQPQAAEMTVEEVPWQLVGEIAKRFVDNESPPEVWPFARQDLHALSPKKVFVHYFPPLPISIDNKPVNSDYWATQYLQRSGEGNKYANVGGYVRQRPLPAGPWQATYWREIDVAIDVLRARMMGADGFGVDILQLESGRYWDQVRRVCAAASALTTNFYFVPEFDAIALAKASTDEIVRASETLAACPAIYRLNDGRILFIPFSPNAQTPEYWREVEVKLANKGIAIAFVPDLLDLARTAEPFAPISAGLSFWGARDPTTVNSEALKRVERYAASLAKYWMQPVAPQDARPKSSILWEAANTGLLRASWMSAIESGAELVHMITWNDYGEATEFAPSTGAQFLFYDLSAYYIQWLKTGRAPTIINDAIYYCHRTQVFDPQKAVTQGDRPFKVLGMTAVQNNVEMIAMLTRPAKPQIKLQDKYVENSVGAGLQLLKIPAAPGRPTFRIIRDGRIILEKISDWAIDSDPKVANADYFGGSTTRRFYRLPSQ